MEKWTRLLIVIATVLLLLTFFGVAIHLGTYIHHTLLLFSLGALVAYALDPLAEGLRRIIPVKPGKEPSRELSVSMVFVALLLILGFGVWSLGGAVVHQVTELQQNFPQYRQEALDRAAGLDATLAARNIHFSMTDTLLHPPKEAVAVGETVGKEAVPFLSHVVTDFGESIIVLLIALYFLLFGAEMRERFNGLLPTDLGHRADLLETDMSRILGGFVRGQLIIALIMGSAAALGCLLIGIKPWLLIGLFVVIASLIPVFGPYIGAVPAVIAALAGHTHLHPVFAAAVTVVLFVAINEIGSKVLYPKLVGQALGLHTVLVLFVLFAGLEIDGIVGVLFAAPITALVIVAVVHLYRLWQELPDTLLSTVAKDDGRIAEHQPLP
jgi:predicted PurR-regulated permease PerM